MSIAPVPDDLTLEDAISQVIDAGASDPYEIYRELNRRHGADWIVRRLTENAEEIVCDFARQRLGVERRSAISALRPTNERRPVTKREAIETSLFIPSKGWILLGDATSDDLAEAVQYRRKMAATLTLWADWFEELRDRLRAQGADRVRDLRGSLPPLPSSEQLELEA